MTCNLRLSGVKFQKSQKVGLVGQIIRQNEALDIVFSEKLFPRSFRVTRIVCKNRLSGGRVIVAQKNAILKKARHG